MCKQFLWQKTDLMYKEKEGKKAFGTNRDEKRELQN